MICLERRRLCAAAVLLAVASSAAQSQSFPSRPITIVVPYPPGASTDQVARLVQVKLQASTGQTVIIENKPGANGSVGAAYVAKSPPDGYRLLVATQPIVTINPHLQKDTGFSPFKELTPLTNAVDAVVAVAVNASLPVNSLAELIAYVKAHPGKVSFGSAGAGSPQHIGGVLLAQRAQMDWTHVPYKGGGPMLTDLLAGHVQAGIATLSVFKPMLADRRIKVLAVGDKSRFAGAPDIPTIAETLPGFELTTWLAFYGPGGLPADVSSVLVRELVKALNADDVKQKLQESALLVHADGPEQLDRIGRSEYETYGRVVRERGITAD